MTNNFVDQSLWKRVAAFISGSFQGFGLVTSIICRAHHYWVLFLEADISMLLSCCQNWTCPWRSAGCPACCLHFEVGQPRLNGSMWERVLQTSHSHPSINGSGMYIQAFSLHSSSVILVLHEKKWLSQTVARVLNLTLCWICHPQPDSFYHDLIYSPLNLSKKYIGTSRRWP